MSIIASIKDAIGIVDVAEQYMMLRKQGKSYKGLCPFHSERSPSFNVYPDSASYHCYGCSAHGSVIDLYAHFNELELDTRSAIKKMLSQYGISNTELSVAHKQREEQKVERNQRKALRANIQKAIVDFERQTRKISNDVQLDHYAGLYHEVSKFECWLHNVDYYAAEELTEMLPDVSLYLDQVYKAYWGGERVDRHAKER